MALIRWRHPFEGFGDIRDLQERLNRLFDEGYGGISSGVEQGTSTFPPIDIRHDQENIYVVAEVPGVSLEALDISITGDTLTIKGERRAPEVAEERWHRRERSYGHFTRLVAIKEKVDADRVKARLRDGILEVTLPKAESARPRQIHVAQG
jgi:HSP20 family protein